MMTHGGLEEIKVPERIMKETAKVAKRIGSLGVRDFVNAELAEPSSYLLRKPGKMLRPALVFLGADYMGVRDLGEYVGLGAAIELLHTSSLMHDDIVDKDIVRRGIEATHLRYGTERAILGGDALISKAIQEANRYGERVVGSISEAAMKMCAGEMMDYGYQRDSLIPGLKDYLKVAELKSSTLIGVSTSIAAVHRSDRSARRLYHFGMALGTAFQIRDDVIDFFGLGGARSRERSGYRLNVVRCIKEQEGSVDEAVGKALELNRAYVRKAILRLGNSKNASLFRDYAGRVELPPEGKLSFR